MSITLEVLRFIIRNPQHLLHYLLSPPSAASQSYHLRHRAHNRSLYPINIYQSVRLPTCIS